MKLSVCMDRAKEAAGDGMFRLIKDCGFDACDFMLSHTYGKTDAVLRAYCEKLRRLADEAGVEIGQTHADFSLTSKDFAFSAGWSETFDRAVASIKATSYLGVRYCVLHPVRVPGRYNGKLVEECYAEARDFYARLIPYLEKYDVVCCIENMWARDPYFGRICATILSRPEEMVRMCDELNAIAPNRFAICVDVGHAELTQDVPHEMIRICGSRVKVLHLHDTDGISDLHTIPYSVHGKPAGTEPMRTDWKAVMQALREIGYEGTLNFEVTIPGPTPLVPAGLRYLGKIGRYLETLFENATPDAGKEN